MTVNTQELRELLEKATPGPWAVRYDYVVVQAPSFDDGRLVPVAQPYGVNSDGTDLFANARLIAAARNALPTLLAEIDALRERLEINSEAPGWDGIACRVETIRNLERENDALRAELQAHRDFLPALQYELGLVLTDDDTELSPGAHRALLWADQQISRALATPPAPPQGETA